MVFGAFFPAERNRKVLERTDRKSAGFRPKSSFFGTVSADLKEHEKKE